MTVAAMLRHNLVHVRDLLAAEYIVFLIFSGVFLAVLVWLARTGDYRFRIRPQLPKPAQMGRELFNSSRAFLIYNGSQIVMRIAILAFGFILTFDRPLPLWQVVLSYPLILIVHDAYFYWTHWLMHLPAVFRPVHWEHHRSRQPTVLTAHSFSFSESIVQGLFPILYVTFFPCTFPTLIFFYMVMISHDVAIHSGIDVFPRWLVVGRFGFVCGTVHHDIHHAIGRTNYGLYTRLWDRLMHTEHPNFERIYEYVHSPANDGLAYRRWLGRPDPQQFFEAPRPSPRRASYSSAR
jgi:sterol desaturase/sphingolipid hydroxylase (fatty acid hydroxylase superfamily)